MTIGSVKQTIVYYSKRVTHILSYIREQKNKITMNFKELITEYIEPHISSCVLMGSRARNDNGKYGDIDILRVIHPGFKEKKSEKIKNVLINNVLASISTQSVSEIEKSFINPFLATERIQGLRDAKILYDPEGIFTSIREKANEFTWNKKLQLMANEYAGEELVGWAEEAYKGIEGIIRKDPGRLLQAKHGLTWGLVNIMRTYKGILIKSDNSFLSQLVEFLGEKSQWIIYLKYAFGISGNNMSLMEQVAYGLRLYVLTVDIIKKDLLPEHLEIIEHTVKCINDYFSNNGIAL